MIPVYDDASNPFKLLLQLLAASGAVGDYSDHKKKREEFFFLEADDIYDLHQTRRITKIDDNLPYAQFFSDWLRNNSLKNADEMPNREESVQKIVFTEASFSRTIERLIVIQAVLQLFKTIKISGCMPYAEIVSDRLNNNSMDQNPTSANRASGGEPSFHEAGFAETKPLPPVDPPLAVIRIASRLQEKNHWPQLFQKEKSQGRGERLFSESPLSQTPPSTLKEEDAFSKVFASRVSGPLSEPILPDAVAYYSVLAGQPHFETAKKLLFSAPMIASVFPYAELFYTRSISILKQKKKKKRDEFEEREETDDDWLTAND